MVVFDYLWRTALVVFISSCDPVDAVTHTQTQGAPPPSLTGRRSRGEISSVFLLLLLYFFLCNETSDSENVCTELE